LLSLASLSLGLRQRVTAEVRFTGGEVQPSHLDLLAKYLELAKSAIETEENDTG